MKLNAVMRKTQMISFPWGWNMWTSKAIEQRDSKHPIAKLTPVCHTVCCCVKLHSWQQRNKVINKKCNLQQQKDWTFWQQHEYSRINNQTRHTAINETTQFPVVHRNTSHFVYLSTCISTLSMYGVCAIVVGLLIWTNQLHLIITEKLPGSNTNTWYHFIFSLLIVETWSHQ